MNIPCYASQSIRHCIKDMFLKINVFCLERFDFKADVTLMYERFMK